MNNPEEPPLKDSNNSSSSHTGVFTSSDNNASSERGSTAPSPLDIDPRPIDSSSSHQPWSADETEVFMNFMDVKDTESSITEGHNSTEAAPSVSNSLYVANLN